jgi:hemerythrin-like domain-containing protein
VDAITVLKDDHKLVRRLFKEFAATTDRAVKTRERLARRMVKELSIHAAIEEQVLYPRVRQVLKKGDQLADHALEEHQEAKELLDRIDGLAGDDPQLAGLVEQLTASVTHHVKEEEGDLFKQLRAEVARKDLTEWGEELQAARKKAPTHPHPHAPNQPPANKLVGIMAGRVDRARDKARKQAS